MWILTAPVPNSTVFNALILHALQAKKVDISEQDKVTITKKLREDYPAIDNVKKQTIFYGHEFSFENDKDETITVELKLRFVETGFQAFEYNTLYGMNAAQTALTRAGIFKDSGLQAPRPMLYASKAKTKSAPPLLATNITTSLDALKPKSLVYTKADEVTTSGNKAPTQHPKTPNMAIPKPNRLVKEHADTVCVAYKYTARDERSDSLKRFYDMDGVSSQATDDANRRDTSSSTVTITTPGLPYTTDQDFEEEVYSAESGSSLQFTMT